MATSGVKVIAMTFDGLASNITMCNALKADVYNEKPFFLHPIDNHYVYIILNATHMLKLLRNALASKRVLYDSDGNFIKFEYLEKLVELQENGNFHLAKKLTKKHILWFKNKINVKLAVQTLSESCAAALEQLSEDGNANFVGCTATVKFCRIVNIAFDCLNSRSLYSYGFKKPVKRDTGAEMFKFFDKAIDYFSALKLEPAGQFVIKSKIRTGVLGFIIDLQNLRRLYMQYVETIFGIHFIIQNVTRSFRNIVFLFPRYGGL